MQQLDASVEAEKLNRCFIIHSNLGANQPNSNKKHPQSNCCLSQLSDLFVGVEKKKLAQSLTRYKLKPGSSQKVLESEQGGHKAAKRLGNLWQQNS